MKKHLKALEAKVANGEIETAHPGYLGSQDTFYTIESQLKYSIAKQEIEVRIYPEGIFRAFFAGRELKIREVVQPSKRVLYEPEIQNKIDAIELAKKLRNVSEASRISGVSRQTIYKNKKLLEAKGPMALKKTYDSNCRHKNRPPAKVEEMVIEFSLDNPHLGQAQVSRYFKEKDGVDISAGGVRNIWLRYNMQTMKLRLGKRNPRLPLAS